MKRTKHIKAKKNVAPQQKKRPKAKSLSDIKPKEQQRKGINKKKPLKKKGKTNRGVPALVNNEDIDSEMEEDIREMLDLDDKNIQQDSSSESDAGIPVRFSDKIPTNAKNAKKRKVASAPEIDNLEKEYAKQHKVVDIENKKMKELLPIKTKKGIVPREIEVDDYEENKLAALEELENEEDQEDVESLKEDSDEEIIMDNEVESSTAVQGTAMSMADLLIHRENELQKQKFKIGIICSGILEQPEDRVKNFKSLFELMSSKTKEGQPNLLSVRKISMISAMEVFKDILPDYKLGVQDMEHLKLKKTTMNRISYENTLVQQYKKFLQHLDRVTMVASKKMKGISEQQVSLAESGCHCLCELLVANPNFNFSQNIAQSLVYLSNSRFSHIRERVNQCFRKIFVSDKRLDLTFFVSNKSLCNSSRM